MAALTIVNVARAHAIDANGGQLQPRNYPTSSTATCDPIIKTVTKTDHETKTVISVRALLTITVGGGVTNTETETVTNYLTSSPTSCPASCPAPPSCNNLGFDSAYYNNSAHNGDTIYSNFHPESYKHVRRLYVSTTSYVGDLYGQSGAQVPSGPIYDSDENLKLNYFPLNHRAYLYACEGGTYRITIPYANDAVYLWTGAKAYSGWTDDNADAKARYNRVRL